MCHLISKVFNDENAGAIKGMFFVAGLETFVMKENQEDKTAGKVVPIKLSEEELKRRKHEPDSKDEEGNLQPAGKGGQASRQGAESEPKR